MDRAQICHRDPRAREEEPRDPVGERPGRAEAGARVPVDRPGVHILVRVKAIDGLESHPPKGQGFLRNASSAKS